MSSDESDESDKEESGKLGSEPGLLGMFGNGLGGLSHGLGFTLGVTISSYDSCDCERGLISLS